ncbi:hypothetical protein P3W45_001273 [Vairimorpha bombi]|jgi:hypothetical protein
MDFAKDLFMHSIYNKILELIVCFCKFNFKFSELISLIRFVYNDLLMYFYKNKQLQKVDDEVYMIYDGDMKYFEEMCSKKKTNKKNDNPIMCWDIKNNVKIQTSLTMMDLIKLYSKNYKIKNALKSAMTYKSDDVYIVLTDLSRSTQLWNTDRFKMAKSIVEHDRIAYKLMKKNNGVELRNEGDSFLVAFFTKNECLDFVHKFYKNVSNISYDDNIKIGVKIAVNYDRLPNTNFNKPELFDKIVDKTYKMISHSSIDRICIKHSAIKSEEKKLYCIH